MSDFRTLIDPDTIHRRIAELARELAACYPDVPPCAICVIEGARKFARHLTRQLDWRAPVHEIRADSYGDGTASNGDVKISGGRGFDVAGREVLLIEDIVDTGRTVASLRGHFLAAGATDVAVATLLSKPSRREVDVELQFVGFEIPNEFVIGFGMDFAGRYRELDRVAVYEESRVIAPHG